MNFECGQNYELRSEWHHNIQMSRISFEFLYFCITLFFIYRYKFHYSTSRTVGISVFERFKSECVYAFAAQNNVHFCLLFFVAKNRARNSINDKKTKNTIVVLYEKWNRVYDVVFVMIWYIIMMVIIICFLKEKKKIITKKKKKKHLLYFVSSERSTNLKQKQRFFLYTTTWR